MYNWNNGNILQPLGMASVADRLIWLGALNKCYVITL